MNTPPLSAFQQRLWILHELEPDGHQLAAGFRVRGPLDPTAVAAAWNACVARHAVLRSVFPAREGAPRVESLPIVALAASIASAPPASGQEREAFLRGWLDEACARPFDLASGPLARLALLRLADDDHILLLTAHRSVCDERSLRLLLDELGGAAAPSRPDFAEAARAQQAWLASAAAAAELGFWRQRLAGIPEALELPCDHPRPRVQVYRRGSMGVLLPPEAGTAVAIRDAAPQAPLVVAAFAALLHRHSREEDLVIGWSRLAASATAPLGPCDEPLVLRLAIGPATTARGLAGDLRAEAEQALRHRALPFARLVDALAPRRDLGRTPLFQVMVAESPPPRLALGERAELLVQELVPSRCDLALVIEDPVAVRVRLDYNAALFDEATIARIAGHLRILVAAAAAEPDRALAALPLLAADERRQVVADWNRTAAGFPDQGVHQLVARRAALSPDAVAVAHGRTTLSYGELDQRAGRLAARLRSLGIGRDRVVGLCAERSCEAMVAVLAVLKAGGAYLPLDPAYPIERLAFMLADAKATVLLSQRHLAARLPAGGATVVLLDEPQPEAGDAPPDQAPAPEQLAYVIYTSGSTGVPKGIAMPHGPLANLIAWQLGRSQAGPGARTLQFSSLSFDVSFQELFSTWCAGGTLVLVDETVRRDPLALLRLLAAERVERLFLPFVALQQLAEASVVEAAPLRLREVITAGEQLRITPAIAAWFARLPGCTLHNHYGPSESHVVTAHELAGAPATWPELPPIGRPIANARIYLLDGLREPVPVGVAGELWIAGPVLARGYLGRPELTAERFAADPFVPGGTMYRSGDLARWRGDGSIDFLGRVDQQVKLRGFRVELGEVEAALARHPAVRAAAAVVREVEPGDRRLLAYVVAEPAGADLPLELRRLLQQRLPDYLVPSAIALIDRLPLTPSGKLDRRALPAIAQPRATAAHVAPRNDLEQAIARVWREVLRTERVGSDDNFFDLGGHSLHLVQVTLRLRESLGQELPITTLFQHSTVGALARHLGELRAGRADTALAGVKDRAARQRQAMARQQLLMRGRKP